eukprot:9267578-Heterocapsa_arctica.AAC.1
MENLQESQMLPMQHHRQGGNHDRNVPGKGRHDQLPRKNQDRGCELERDHCEKEDQKNWRAFEEQQNREIEASKIRCDQTNDGRGQGSHRGRDP